MGVIKLNKQNDVVFEQLPKELEIFQQNMCDKFGSSTELHNMYHLQLTDMDGNTENYFGMNIMTDYYFHNLGYADVNEGTTGDYPRYIYIGDGIDQDHQPSRDNKIMFHVLTTSTYSTENITSSNLSPIKYNSTSGYITQAVKVCKTVYDYNITGIDTDVQCNEIGYGRAYNNLFSHSKIYDESGNEKTITKRLNQRLTIELYWVVAVHRSVYEALWTNGLYGGFAPWLFIWPQRYTKGSRHNIYQWLGRCSGSYTFGQVGYNIRDYDVLALNPMFSDYRNIGDSIVANNDERTWTSTTRTKENSWTMDKSKWDYFSNIALNSDFYRTTIINPMYASLFMYKRYHLATPETIETVIKTWNYDKSDFYHTIGVDCYVDRASDINNSYIRLRGYLPVTNMNIQSLYRYNFATSEWDVPETFNNPYENEYDYFGFFNQFYAYMKWPDNVSRQAYISVNPDYQTKAVTKFNGSGFTCYATDTWWDVSSWEAVSNTASVPQSLQNKKFYISSKAVSGYSNGPWVGSESSTGDNFWWPYPEFEYQNGIHSIDPAFSPAIDEVTAMGFDLDYGSNSIRFVDETAEYYVQNHIVIRKPEESTSIMPTRNLFTNGLSYIQSEFPNTVRFSVGNVFYTEDGKMIHIPVCRYVSNNNYYINGIRMFIHDLSLSSANIDASLEYVNTTSSFTDPSQNLDGNWRLYTLSNYVVVFQKSTGEFVTVDTDTLQCTLAPFTATMIRKIYGTTKLWCCDDNTKHCKIFDVATQTVDQEFDIPSDYAINNCFAFEDWVYIKCKLGTTDALLMYVISDDALESITCPTALISGNFYGFTYASTSLTDITENYINSPNRYINACNDLSHVLTDYVQYKDGICVLSPTDPESYGSNVLIISRYNPENIITQQYEFYSSKTYQPPRLCLNKIYENYYLAISYRIGSNSSYSKFTSRILDIGRIVRNDAPVTSSSETYRVDMLPSYRDGIINESYAANLFTIYKNKIYEYTNQISGCQVRVLPPEGFISHKINFTTTTCCAWNNPKKVTYPSFNITVTNNV